MNLLIWNIFPTGLVNMREICSKPCSCRRSRLTHDEGCADDPEGWCVAVGDMADYVVETQKTDVIFQKKKHWIFSDRQKKTVLYIRSQTLMVKIRFLLSVTVM